MEDDPAAGKRAACAWERYVPAVIAYPDDKGVLTKYRIGQVTAPPPPLTVTDNRYAHNMALTIAARIWSTYTRNHTYQMLPLPHTSRKQK